MSEFTFGKKRSVYLDAGEFVTKKEYSLSTEEEQNFVKLDIIYRALCSALYNFAPLSGHPGGSISSGRLVSQLIFNQMKYDFASPLREEADVISYAAGHKALGMYSLWALRNECVAQAAPGALPKDEKFQLRLEDLLGFRRNKATQTPLFKKFNVKPLGGHTEPLVPFVRTATGASGVGAASAVGMAFAAAAAYGAKAPTINILDGEGALTAGRVSEALAAAASACLNNAVFHLDWNQSSIDSDKVVSDGQTPGDYAQWTPMELFHINDWNVIFVPEGLNFNQIYAAQKLAAEINNSQPTAIIYRTIKGWRYGLEGKIGHGSGHKFCSDDYFKTLADFEAAFGVNVPRFEGENTPENVEKAYYDTLMAVREALKKDAPLAKFFAGRVAERKAALDAEKRAKDPKIDVEKVYSFKSENTPEKFVFTPAAAYTLRGVLADALNYINTASGGALLTGSADLYGSTNAGTIAKGFGKGFYNKVSNPGSKEFAPGGICEDAMNAIATGISAFGSNIGVSSSYAAFLAFGHVAMRMHAIGQQCLHELTGEGRRTVIMYNAHASLPTGEDGPTHADPQSLQLMQENFPKGACITITPWEVDEIWPLVTASLNARPAVFSPFATRPSEKFVDRAALGLAPAGNSVKGIYKVYSAEKPEGTVILQGAGVMRIFVTQVLPQVKNVDVYYVTSRELFDLLTAEEREQIIPESVLKTAMMITDFTLPTIHAWVMSEKGRAHSLWPNKSHGYLGSARADITYVEAGLDAKGQISAIQKYIEDLKAA